MIEPVSHIGFISTSPCYDTPCRRQPFKKQEDVQIFIFLVNYISETLNLNLKL